MDSVDNCLPVRPDFIRALLAILGEGIQDNQLDDADKLFSAIKILSPSLACIDDFTSFIAIKRGMVREALQIFLAAPADTSKWYVMTALCLKLAGDPTWHWHACQALEKDDPSAEYSRNLARALLGHKTETDSISVDQSMANKIDGSSENFSNSYANYLSI